MMFIELTTGMLLNLTKVGAIFKDKNDSPLPYNILYEISESETGIEEFATEEEHDIRFDQVKWMLGLGNKLHTCQDSGVTFPVKE